MIEDKDLEKFHRMDIQKIESRDKLCLKEPDEIKSEQEFNHVETSYKRLRQTMLHNKFDTIYNDRANADNKEHKKLKRTIDKEDRRK